MTNGKKYLLAANHPDRLAAAIRAAKTAAIAQASLTPSQPYKGARVSEEAKPAGSWGARQTVSWERYPLLNWLIGLLPAGVTAGFCVFFLWTRNWTYFAIFTAFFIYLALPFFIFNRRN
jgi:hypothetical protein